MNNDVLAVPWACANFDDITTQRDSPLRGEAAVAFIEARARLIAQGQYLTEALQHEHWLDVEITVADILSTARRLRDAAIDIHHRNACTEEGRHYALRDIVGCHDAVEIQIEYSIAAAMGARRPRIGESLQRALTDILLALCDAAAHLYSPYRKGPSDAVPKRRPRLESHA